MILDEKLAESFDTIIRVRDSDEKISIDKENARKMFDEIRIEVAKISAITASILSRTDVCIEKTYTGRYDIYLVMPKMFARQFLRQKTKVEHLKKASEKLLGNNVCISIGSWKSDKLRMYTLATNKWWSSCKDGK